MRVHASIDISCSLSMLSVPEFPVADAQSIFCLCVIPSLRENQMANSGSRKYHASSYFTNQRKTKLVKETTEAELRENDHRRPRRRARTAHCPNACGIFCGLTHHLVMRGKIIAVAHLSTKFWRNLVVFTTIF